MNRILLSIIKKEFWHILRDPQTLVIILVMPLFMLLLYGYAITLEMKNIDTVIIDHSKTPQSRQFIEKMLSTDFFNITAVDVPDEKIEQIFYERKARCVVVIPVDFASDLQKDIRAKIQLIIDASDPNAANYINKYFNQLSMNFNYDINPQLALPFNVDPRIFYNPDLKAEYFFVPGLIAVIILLISALLTSIAIVREKEVGTMEQILVSPVHPLQIIIGKVIPYTVLGFIDSILILLVGHFWFGVPVLGSVGLLLISLIVYILTGLSFGLMISTITDSQQLAMMATLLSTILPTIMLSGFIFPIKSMPVIFQYISKIIPATHFLEIIRGIMLRGNTFFELNVQLGYLLGIAALLIFLSVRKFSTKLE
ncbi:MAG: ABC transporter permease [Calditrichaceae bacterium]